MLPTIFEKVNNRGLRGEYQARPVPYIACGACGAQRHEPCIGAHGYTLGTHSARRYDFSHGLLGIKRLFDLLRVLGGPHSEDQD